MNWSDKKVLVTGGASFIGSHLVDVLIEKGAQVRVVDNLSSGKLENIQEHLGAGRVEFVEKDLLEPGVAQEAVRGLDVVFHLAADHGGRGYVDLHQAACATNLALDGIVFNACYKAGVEKVVYASSGCVYPNFLQTDPDRELYLTEDLVRPPYDADNMYGWAKLMGELTLQAYYRDWGMRAASCRYFTVYGARGHENHAVIAMIARSFVDQDPFVVWGTGEQIRNWTHVSDIVRGTILAAEEIDDGTAINLGTMERVRVIDAVHEVLRYTGKEHLQIKLHPGMPTGPLNRVADNTLARKLLDWEPAVKFADGLHATIDWYYAVKDKLDLLKQAHEMEMNFVDALSGQERARIGTLEDWSAKDVISHITARKAIMADNLLAVLNEDSQGTSGHRFAKAELPRAVFGTWRKPDGAINPVAIVATVDADRTPRTAPFGNLRPSTPRLPWLCSEWPDSAGNVTV